MPLLLLTATLLFLVAVILVIKHRPSSRPSNTENGESLERLISELHGIRKGLHHIRRSTGLQTRIDTAQEVELLQQKLRIVGEQIQEKKNINEERRTAVLKQIRITWTVFSEIRKLLELDYESLLIQRNTLAEELARQESRFARVKREFEEESARHARMLENLKTAYPNELMEKLRFQVAEKTRILERLENDYGALRAAVDDKVRFLDEVLIRKSGQLEAWIESVKRTGELELVKLKESVDSLQDQVDDLNRRTKAFAESVRGEQTEQNEAMRRLHSELDDLRSRQYEVESLKSREQYLGREVLRLNAELAALQQEYRTAIDRKGDEIRRTAVEARRQSSALYAEWREQEYGYRSEILALKERIRRLERRRDRLQRAAEHRRLTNDRKRRDLEETVRRARAHYELGVARVETEIRTRIRRLEAAEESLRVRFETLRTLLDRRVRDHDDRISDLKRRSDARERKIRREIARSSAAYTAVIAELQTRERNAAADLELLRRNADAAASVDASREAALRERHATFAAEVERLTARMEAARGDAVRLETELHRTEEQVRRRMREVYGIIARKKRDLVCALERLLEAQQVLIVKLPGPPGREESAAAADAGVDETEGEPGNPVP